METIFYLYGLIFILFMLNSIYIKRNLSNSNPIDVSNGVQNTFDELSNPKIFLKPNPKTIFFFVDIIWIVIGYFTAEKIFFICITLTTLTHTFLVMNKNFLFVKKIYILFLVIKIMLVLTIMYSHFKNI